VTLSSSGFYMLLAILAPLAGALICVALSAGWAKEALVATAVAQMASVAVLFARVMQTGDVVVEYAWMKSIGSTMTFRADALSVTFAVLVSGLCLLDAIYARGYMDPDVAKNSFYAWQSLFAGSMVGVLFAGDMILFYLFWELMLIPSTALIVYWGKGKSPLRVGIKYYMVTHVGAVFMLLGILWTMVLTGTSDMGAAAEALLSVDPAVVLRIGGLFVAGFMVKMAVVPGHIWLPDAHSEAELPTSVMLSAIMMNMGIYGILRFLDGIVPPSSLASLAIPLMALGVVNQWYGGIQALRQVELKRIAAYSTISQMGYVLFGLGTASALGTRGAIMQAFAHGMGKALLFMTIGVVIHSTGAHRIDEVSGLGRRMPLTMLCAVVAALTLSGAPPFAAFQSEWQIFAAGMSRAGFALTLASIAAGIVTALYCLGLVMRVFYGTEKSPEGRAHDAGAAMMAPMLVLAVASLAVGVFPAVISTWAEAAVTHLLR